MPEVFTNYYTFSTSVVPPAETFCARLAEAFGQALTLEAHACGFHGAPRAYASLTGAGMQIWIFWQPDRPEVEVAVDEPMERMIALNAAIGALGGQARYADSSWRARRRGRTRQRILRGMVIAGLVMLAAATIWYLHWWGLLLVVATIVIAATAYLIGLARAFSNR